jgi:hypothetical protein
MDTIPSNVLLLRAELAWCDVCSAEQLLVPDDDDSGLCCTACDSAVFVLADVDLESVLDHHRRSA